MLPKIDYPIFTCKLPVEGVEVKFRPFNLHEEKLLLTAKEEQPLIYLTEIDKVVQNCIMSEQKDIKYLIDFIYLFNNIRAKAKGETVEGTVHCENCKQPTPVTIDLLTSLKVLNENNKSKIVVIDDKLSFEIVPTKKAIIYENIDLNNEIDIANYTILFSIDKVIYNNQIYDKFTIEELQQNIINNLSSQQIEKILTAITEMPSLEFQYKIKCIHCGHEMEYKEADFSAFFTL